MSSNQPYGGSIPSEQEGIKRLFYVPVDIRMIQTAVQDVDECKIDGVDIKSVP